MAPPSYLPNKATKFLGKMSDPVRDATRSEFLNKYRTAPPPYFVRCPNIVMHSLDYVDLSAEKRFFKHRQVRPLADIEKKHQMEERQDPPLLAREGIYGKIVKPFPQKPAIDSVAAGVREVQRHGTALPATRRKPVTSEDIQPKPATNISRISVAGRTLGRRAWSCGVPPTAQQEKSSTARFSSAKGSKSKRSGSAAIDSHMRIKVDREYFDALKNDQLLRYELQRHFNPDHNPLGDPSLARMRYCVGHRTRYNQVHCRCRGVNPSFYPQEPSKWLSFTGKKPEQEPSKNDSSITAFFHDRLAHNYSVEQSTGCTVAHSLLEREYEITIGINGQLAPSQISEEEVKAKETARNAIFFDDPRVPLCWDDQLRKSGVRVVDAGGKDQTTSSKYGSDFHRRLITVPRVPPSQRPTICERGTNVSRENQMVRITRHTRALENSKVTQLPAPAKRELTATEKSKKNEPLSYEDVLEILRNQDHQKAREEMDEAQAQEQQESHNLINERPSIAPSARPSPCPPSPLLSPSGGLVKPFSANSFRSSQPELQLELRLRLRPTPKEGNFVENERPSAGRGRIITGARLHKTAAARGASIGNVTSEDAEFINFVSPCSYPTQSEALHDVATNLVRQRTFESRNEMVGGRQYPCTPVSHQFEDYTSDDNAEAPDAGKTMMQNGRSEQEASCPSGTVQSEMLESPNATTRSVSAASFDPVTIPRAEDLSPS